jgi:hypothetical protein
MANTLHISFLEMLLMKGMAASDAWFSGEENVKWVYDFDANRFAGKRNTQKAVDTAVANGIIEMDMTEGDRDTGVAIRLTKLGEKLLKAAEPAAYTQYQEHSK